MYGRILAAVTSDETLNIKLAPLGQQGRMEIAYHLAIGEANLCIQQQIDEIGKKRQRLVKAISEMDESRSLQLELKKLEKEADTLSSQLIKPVFKQWRQKHDQFMSVVGEIQKLRNGDIDGWTLKRLFNEHGIKIIVQPHDESFITIQSENGSARCPSMRISKEEYRTKYMQNSWASRPQQFQKGNHYGKNR
jgi:hypothetical protein